MLWPEEDGSPTDDGLYDVGANILGLEKRFAFRPADFRLWIALHEVTHRAQFTGVPWLREYFLAQVHELVGSIEPDPGVIFAAIRRASGAIRPGRSPVGERRTVGLLGTPSPPPPAPPGRAACPARPDPVAGLAAPDVLCLQRGRAARDLLETARHAVDEEEVALVRQQMDAARAARRRSVQDVGYKEGDLRGVGNGETVSVDGRGTGGWPGSNQLPDRVDEPGRSHLLVRDRLERVTRRLWPPTSGRRGGGARGLG